MSTKTRSPIAIAAAGRNGEVRLYGAISNDLHALESADRSRPIKAHFPVAPGGGDRDGDRVFVDI